MFTVIAILFVANDVYVAHVGPDSGFLSFRAENTVAGVRELTARIQPLLVASASNKPPLLCMGTAEGTSLHGPVFEQLVFQQDVRRFMYAQPKYLIEAKALGLSSQDPVTLLKVCREAFPGSMGR